MITVSCSNCQIAYPALPKKSLSREWVVAGSVVLLIAAVLVFLLARTAAPAALRRLVIVVRADMPLARRMLCLNGSANGSRS